MQALMRQLKSKQSNIPAHVIYTPSEIKSAKVVLQRVLRETQKTSTVQSITPVVQEVSE